MVPMACLPAREKRAAARSARDFSGWRMSGIGLGVGGSGAMGKGVMYFSSPCGGPVSVDMLNAVVDDGCLAEILR